MGEKEGDVGAGNAHLCVGISTADVKVMFIAAL